MTRVGFIGLGNMGGPMCGHLASGGFDVDLIGGIEFMRASKVQFLLQLALMLPAYVVENGDSATPIKSWFPGAGLSLGMMF